MEKEKQKRIDPEQAARLTRELFHQQYRGNPEAWFAYLCPESVYLGTGEPLLFGGEAIREHFARRNTFPLPWGRRRSWSRGISW